MPLSPFFLHSLALQSTPRSAHCFVNHFVVFAPSRYNGASKRPDAQLQHNTVRRFVVAGRVQYGGGELLVLVPKATAAATAMAGRQQNGGGAGAAGADAGRAKRGRADSGVDTLMVLGGSGDTRSGRTASELKHGALVDVRIKKIFRREMHVQVRLSVRSSLCVGSNWSCLPRRQ